ncbi:hypothetical protein BBJ28_00008384 [Nothophytophthora sp. Chile5]|nr:hypothetical protein BBJ28_00008384 [Nothophytophthora sp. Chile5]
MVSTLYFCTLAALAFTTVVEAATYYEGDGTTYTLSAVGNGNCNFMSAMSNAPSNYAALNQAQWGSLTNCGRCAEVSCIDSKCTDKTKKAIVQIVDRCPECSYGDLDMSPSVFKTITGSSPSRYKIRWQFVDCPTPGTIKVCLKEGSNPWWVAVQPTNTLVGVKSVTVNGKATTMLDGAYYYLIQSSTEVNLSAVQVSVTSINGGVVKGTYALKVGQCTDTKQQFK